MKRLLFAMHYVQRGETMADGMCWVNVYVVASSIKDGERRSRAWARKKVKNLGRIVETERLPVLFHEY